MRVARTTRQRVAEIKAEASQPKQHLALLLARLEEHSGTKRIAAPLRQAIEKIEQWQRG